MNRRRGPPAKNPGASTGSPCSTSLQPPSPGPQQTCRVDDPFVMRPFWSFMDESLDAYLVGLAAFQRGLAVRFHYEVASVCERFARLPYQGARGELLSVSDGRRTHFFRRAQGDRTSREASSIMEDKPSTKAVLAKHGIEVPPGVVVDQHHLPRARVFCRRHPGERFLIKPLAGTLGRDVHRDLTADEVLQRLGSQHDPVLLEVFVRGQEYRVHVVNGRYIGAVARLPAQVQGDGVNTVRALVEACNQRRRHHPLYHNMLIKLDDSVVAELAAQGMNLESIPPGGQWVRLGRVPKNSAGGSSPVRSHEVSEQARRVAVRVQQVLKVPNTGIDLLVCDEGTPRERVVVLEANQCPFQTALVAPLEPADGMGNHAAEALIDTYFPASRQAPRWPAASFDFVALRRMLPNAVASSLGLPVIQRDWQHQRLAIHPEAQQQAEMVARVEAMRGHGAIVQVMSLADGELLIDALGTAPVLGAAWALWPASSGKRVDP